MPARALAAESTDPGVIARSAKYDQLLPYVPSQIPLPDPVWTGVITQLEADGLLSPAQVAAFTTRPDPAWKSILRTTRAAQILSAPFVIEASDVSAALVS
jgi:hypothetical protein